MGAAASIVPVAPPRIGGNTISPQRGGKFDDAGEDFKQASGQVFFW
jgi:hypothetical protein